MRIKRLKLGGFKSFVDAAELRIEPGLTGVVGPNGCGKSNLLEAIRWVMGESSAKSLRGGGMEDVIFAGTATRPAREFAEVSMLIDRPGPHGPEESEVVRRIERGAGSAYRIDGRDVRAKDVGLLFADAATGAHSPALVSQGRIAAVIAAKPQERRLMLEEAAGIAGLHVRRKDAEQKLRATEANLARVDELVADMESRAGALRRQARAAERYRTLSTSIRIAEARLIYARWRDAAAAAEAAKREALGAQAQVAAAGEAQRSAAAVVIERTRAVGDARAAALEARDAHAGAQRSREAIAAERAAVERRIADLGRQIGALESDRAREGALAQDAAAALRRLADERDAIDARIAAAEAALPALGPRRAAAEDASRAADALLGEAMATEAAAMGEARVAVAALAAARARAERADREVAALARDRAALGDPAAAEAQQRSALAARAQAEAVLSDAANAITVAEAAREDADQTRALCDEAAAQAGAALAALTAEERSLAQPGDKASANRLLDHVRAAPGYERALAAALGDELTATLGDGPRAWLGANASGDPSLPEGVASLADHVDAPPALARRLAQIGVVDADEGQPLPAGQSLVTRAGAMRRWDGFVVREAGAAEAERLIRANRLAAIAAQLPEVRARVEAMSAARDQAIASAGAARTAIEAARRDHHAAEQRRRAAAQAEDQASAALERIALRRAAIDERAGRIEEEARAAAAELAAAETAHAALPPVGRASALVTSRRADADRARTTLAGIAADESTLGRGLASDAARRLAAAREAEDWAQRAAAAQARIEEMAKRAAVALAEAEKLAGLPQALEAQAAQAAGTLAELAFEAQRTRDAEAAAEASLRSAEAAQAEAAEALAQAREARAGAAARAEGEELRRVEMSRVAGERFECPAPLLPERVGFAAAEVEAAGIESARLDRLSGERERLGPVNLVAEQELSELDTARVRQAAEREELGEAVNRLRGSIGSLNREGRARLLAAFQDVDRHFRRLFSTLFGGGEAHLSLVDSDDPLEAGLEIMAQPPGKRLAALTLLSGGEQALTAVALVFALFLTNPAPICVLDEVDAPLDDANVERFCDLLDRMTQETETRYLIVTHNAVTMSRMHRLFGVTMVERGVSRLVSVDLGGAERLLAAE